MDDRIYLALYDEKSTKKMAREIGFDTKSYLKDLVLPGYEYCEAGGKTAIRKARFTEISVKLYEPAAEILEKLDAYMAPELERHQAMAADDERLYNVFVYVLKE